MRYICCRLCHEELDQVVEAQAVILAKSVEKERVAPAKRSMGSFERLSVAINDDKTELTIWCNRHGCMVAIIGIAGHFRVIPQGISGQKTYVTGPVT